MGEKQEWVVSATEDSFYCSNFYATKEDAIKFGPEDIEDELEDRMFDFEAVETVFYVGKARRVEFSEIINVDIPYIIDLAHSELHDLVGEACEFWNAWEDIPVKGIKEIEAQVNKLIIEWFEKVAPLNVYTIEDVSEHTYKSKAQPDLNPDI